MKKLRFVYLLFCVLLVSVLFSSHAVNDFARGYASSGDGLCGDCHTPSADAGMIEIEIVSATDYLLTNTPYNVFIKLTRANNAPEGGFQMSAVRDDNSVGTYLSYSSTAELANHIRCQGNGFDCSGGNTIQYLEHKASLNILFGQSSTIVWQAVWKTPSTPGPVTFTAAGVLSDGNGAQTDNDLSVSFSITKDVFAPLSVSATGQNVTCHEGNDGAASVTASGGNGNFSYMWSNGETDVNVYNLTAGTYTVTVTSGGGLTSSASVQISQPPAMFLNASPANTTCPGGSNGSILLSASGGASPYTFLWSNGATSKNITNLTAGTYTVTVTDANGCVAATSAIVAGPPAFSLPLAVTHVTCFGLGNGAINLTPAGGTPPYSYMWTNGATTQDISNLFPGIYTVTVTDSKGCSKSASSGVNEPSIIMLIDTVAHATCFGLNNGSINLTPGGGSPGYSYLWSNDSITQDIANLSAGTYWVVVTDMNNCTKTDTIVVTQPSAVTLSASASNAMCFGQSNGSIDLTPGGGLPGYTYLWSNGATTQDIASLSAGMYSVVVTDMNNCTKADTIAVAQPSAVSLTAAVSNTTCFGLSNGSIDMTPGGGMPGYTYLWSNGATTQDIANLSAGMYSVTVTDMNNCMKTDMISVAQPSAVSLTAAVSNAVCFGASNGSIDLTPGGGTPGYTYLWSNDSTTQDIINLPAGTYFVTVSDINGCTKTDMANVTQPSAIALSGEVLNVTCFGQSNGAIDLAVGGGTPGYTYLWSNGATTQDVANLATGIHSVTVTDMNSCTKSMSFTVIQPTPLFLASTIANVTCFGLSNGSINLTPGGGSGGYTYLWSNGATTQDISNLEAGTYSVTVTDAYNCTNTSTVTVMQPTPLSLSATPSDASCFGSNDGSVVLTAGGGTPDYSFLWSDGSTGQNIENAAAGTYVVTVTDANQCTTTSAATVMQPSDIQLDAIVSNASCFGGDNGSIDLAAAGGAQGFTYIWSNGSFTDDIANLVAGSYTVTVSDASGCKKEGTFEVGEAPQLLLQPTVINISCFASPTGGVLLQASGGTMPYSYLWSNGDTTQHLSGLPVGLYSVTVTDANNCTASASGSVVQAPPMSLILEAEPADCFGAASGNISASVSGGAGVYDFLWSNGSTAQNLTGISAGLYTCTVTDAAGCTVVDSATVEQPLSALSVEIDSIAPALQGEANGAIFITVNGATPPYNYTWTDAESGAIISNLEDLSGVTAGTFDLLVTDANGCEVPLEVIPVPTPVRDIITNSLIHLYPNPNDGRFVVKAESAVNIGGISVRIVDTWGREYYARELTGRELNSGHDVDIEALPSGVYILQLGDSDGIVEHCFFVVCR